MYRVCTYCIQCLHGKFSAGIMSLSLQNSQYASQTFSGKENVVIRFYVVVQLLLNCV